MRTEPSNATKAAKASPWKTASLVTLAALAGSYLVVRNKTSQVERQHPPAGSFVKVDGVKLHYLEQGSGPVVVLLHGNMVRADDFRLSGLMDRLAQSYRVIAFDRPGFGYSDRPRETTWTPDAQAALLHKALAQIEAVSYLVVGHSWGTLVALSMALLDPSRVHGLVLLSGYYYPSVRLDVPVAALPAIPLLGDLMRFTTSPLVGRLLWPMTAKAMFSPNEVPESFKREDPWMLLRPSQVRATAAEAGLMVPMAAELERRYHGLEMPVILMAGENDKIVNHNDQSGRLHKELPNSTLKLVPNAGHMIQHVAQDDIVDAIDSLAAKANLRAPLAHSQARAPAQRPSP